MENYLERDFDDILFENRNKAYGSYALRKSYGKHLKRGAIGGFALFLLLVSSPLIADRIKLTSSLDDEKVVEMIPPPLEDIPKPPPPAPPPPPPPPLKKIEMTRFLPPVVTLEVLKDAPVIVPPIDSTTQIGPADVKGEKTTAYVPPSVPTAPAAAPPPDPGETKVVEDKEFLFVEQSPEYPNGVKAMYQFLSDNMKYPAIARENNIEGTVYVGFVVGKDGAIRNVAVKRGLGGGCNEEAIRVVQLMPKWNAGKQNGRAVSVAFTIPIKFTLQ
jgi:periplasmic protein TonB